MNLDEMVDSCEEESTVLEEQYNRAWNNNVVVYDQDATAGVFTKRLVSLMKTVMRRNGCNYGEPGMDNPRLNAIYMGEDSNIEGWGNLTGSFSISGIPVVRTAELNRDSYIWRKYNTASSFSRGKGELCVGIDQDGDSVLLGMF